MGTSQSFQNLETVKDMQGAAAAEGQVASGNVSFRGQ